jgi:adenosylcobyric acid synthase
MVAKTLMVQGTSSSVGKSILVAALCRYFAHRGLRVAPFKAQNMSNNAAVCPDGSEIGRAQALQAAAAGAPLDPRFNPVLVKPEADARSQIILMGRPWKTLSASEFYQVKDFLWAEVKKALDSLRAEYDLVILEGAGSPAELNLITHDIVNMAVANYAGSPVILVGDIDRGGIFAQLLGTLWLLPPEERQLIRGLIVNKFRGDATLFEDGVRILEERSSVPVLGVIPFIHDLHLPEEDAVALENLPPDLSAVDTEVDIVVLRLPHIANFDDLDPLEVEPGVKVRYISEPAELGTPQAIILPGSKSTIADLEWLRRQGWAEAILDFAANGGYGVGICGGYQMLGEEIYDPQHVESGEDCVPGLGLLPCQTTFIGDKITSQVNARILLPPGCTAGVMTDRVRPRALHEGRQACPEQVREKATWLHRLRHASGIAHRWHEATWLHRLRRASGIAHRWHEATWLAELEGQTISGYEIHMGQTTSKQPWLKLNQRVEQPVDALDGAISQDGRWWGCYLHGIFENTRFRRAWLRSIGWRGEQAGTGIHNDQLIAALNKLESEIERSINMALLEKIIWAD